MIRKIDLLRESIKLILREADESSEFTALVVGDSQSAGGLGRSTVSFLTNNGFSVKRNSKTGAPGAVVTENLKSELLVGKFDLIVAFFGGNDSSKESAIKAAGEIISLAQKNGSYLIMIGPPPATKIANTEKASKVFGDGAKDPDYHLKRDGGRYPERRRSIAQAIEDAGKRVPNVSSYGVAAHFTPGENYPNQPDGIHCSIGAEEIVSQIFQEIGFSTILETIKSKR